MTFSTPGIDPAQVSVFGIPGQCFRDSSSVMRPTWLPPHAAPPSERT